MKKNQGITLIALIITIIVMLILVAVTIQVVINSGLLKTAGDAVSDYKNVQEQESNMDGVTIDGVEYESIEEYITREHNWQYTDNTLSALKCTCKMCTKESAEGKTYYIAQEIPSYEAGPEGTQWVVFGTEDTDKNGTNETLLLTTLKPSTETLELEGADAYNNGMAKIEAKVKEIYGNEARSMKIEDVNRTLGYTPAGGMYQDKNGDWQTTGNFTTKLKDLSTWENIKIKGTYTPNGANTEEALGEYVLNGYMYTATDSGQPGLPYVPKTTSNVVKNLVFGEQGVSELYAYWLDTRSIYVMSFAYFGPGSLSNGYARSFFPAFNSCGISAGATNSVRPIVPLKYEIPAGGDVLVSNEGLN